MQDWDVSPDSTEEKLLLTVRSWAVTPEANSTEATDTTPNKKVGKPYLGIYGESIWKSVRIRDVRRDSPAEKAGLLAEDVIWQIDNTPIESFAELLRYVAGRQGGDQITVGINRYGSQLRIPLTLEAR